MDKTFTIDVTQEDIDLGEGVRAQSCAIARAAKRLPGVFCATVCQTAIQINGTEFEVPHDFTEFVFAFDKYKTGNGPAPLPQQFVISCGSAKDRA